MVAAAARNVPRSSFALCTDFVFLLLDWMRSLVGSLCVLGCGVVQGLRFFVLGRRETKGKLSGNSCVACGTSAWKT